MRFTSNDRYEQMALTTDGSAHAEIIVHPDGRISVRLDGARWTFPDTDFAAGILFAGRAPANSARVSRYELRRRLDQMVARLRPVS